MKPTRDVYSLISSDNTANPFKKYGWEVITSDSGVIIQKYSDLLSVIANVSYYNSHYNLFFRGQRGDFINPGGKIHNSIVLPTIYRPPDNQRRLLKEVKELRSKYLQFCEDCLVKSILERKYINNEYFTGFNKLFSYREMKWSILQHYEVCKTPLLDITQSIQTATTFALRNNPNEYGYIYVIALPYITGAISFYTYEEILNIKLASICMPKALRPHFQEAFLIGFFPLSDIRDSLAIFPQSKSMDFSNRIVLKIRITNIDKFWDTHLPTPETMLIPPSDPLSEVCDRVKYELSVEYPHENVFI